MSHAWVTHLVTWGMGRRGEATPISGCCGDNAGVCEECCQSCAEEKTDLRSFHFLSLLLVALKLAVRKGGSRGEFTFSLGEKSMTISPEECICMHSFAYDF